MKDIFIDFHFGNEPGLPVNDEIIRIISKDAEIPFGAYKNVYLYSNDGFEETVFIDAVIARSNTIGDDSYYLYFDIETYYPHSQAKFKDEYTIEEILGK